VVQLYGRTGRTCGEELSISTSLRSTQSTSRTSSLHAGNADARYQSRPAPFPASISRANSRNHTRSQYIPHPSAYRWPSAPWQDSRNRPLFRRGLQPDEGLRTLRERRALHKIKLPSRPAVWVPINKRPRSPARTSPPRSPCSRSSCNLRSIPLAWRLVSHEWLVSADLISVFGERLRCFRVGRNSSFLARAPNTPSPFGVMAALRRNCSAAPSCRHLRTCTKVPVPVPAHTPRISSWRTSRMPKNRVTCRGLRPSALNF
jgi:hypothetical protein